MEEQNIFFRFSLCTAKMMLLGSKQTDVQDSESESKALYLNNRREKKKISGGREERQPASGKVLGLAVITSCFTLN